MTKEEEFKLCRECTTEGYLGVDIKRNGEKTTLTQSGLKKRAIEALGLNSKYSTATTTPAECDVLPHDSGGEPAVCTFNYAAVVGMLLYLMGHSCPDRAFAVHQCACYTFDPECSHEAALKCIGHYLKGTADCGLILNPEDNLSIDCYPDTEFVCLWGHEHPQYPHCV